MRRICGKKLTLAVVASLLAGTVPAWAADVTGQQVTIDSDQTGEQICGGATTSGSASHNTLSVSGSASIQAADGIVGGGYAENGDAIGNQVTFSSSGTHQIPSLFGGAGFSQQVLQQANENQVTITSGTFFNSDYIVGGYSNSVVNNNTVSIGGTADIDFSKWAVKVISGGYVEKSSSIPSSLSTAKGNRVVLSGGSVTGAELIAGACADHVEHNQVSITGGNLENNKEIAGGQAKNGSASDNTLSVSGSTSVSDTQYATGGYAENGNASHNTLSVSGGTSVSDTQYAAGGYAENGDATGNQVTFTSSGAQQIGEIYGGMAYPQSAHQSAAHKANENQVTITGGTFASHSIFGGYSNSVANDNKVSIGGSADITLTSGHPGAYGIFGGYSDADSSTAERNQVSISGGTIKGADFLVGALSDNVVDNKVSITGGKLENNREIAGGYAEAGNASRNILSVSGSASIMGNQYVAGGYSNGTGIANENQVSITDGTLNTAFITGGIAETSANNNTVAIGGNAIVTFSSTDSYATKMISGGYTYSHEGQGNGNRVDITGGQISHANMLVGGATAVGNDISNNHVTITGGQIEDTQYILGGMGGESNINQENTVTIGKDAVVTAAIIGGGYMADSVLNNMVTVSGTVTGYMIGGSVLGRGIVSGNVLNLAGAALNTLSQTDTSLIGFLKEDGYKEIGESIQAVGGSLGEYGIKAQDNRINLSGSMDLSKTNLYGWSTDVDMKQDASGDDTKELTHSGNTLNVGYLEEMTTDKEGKNTITGKVADWHGSKVRGIYNFEKVAFYNVDPSQTALTVTDTVSLPDNVTLNLDHFASADGGNVLTDNVLIDASGASTVKGLDKLYESGKNKYQQPVTRTYANGGVTVTGKDGLALSADNKLYYGLHSLDAITYKNIDWKTDGTVLTLADSQKFDLADTKVHTEDIGFTAKSLETITKAGDYAMTLLDTQGNKTLSAGNLTTKKGTWNVGNALEGTGEASLDANGNVVYKLDTEEKKVKVDTTAQTHNALIANEAGLGVLAAGRDRMEGMLDTFNDQEGGVFTFASLGGSKDTYDTGSESKTYTWNGLVGVGSESALKHGDFSYGMFYEYGKGHYRVDGAGYTGTGDAHYNGGGLMAKYTARNKNYVEGSLHLGQLKNSADSVLHGKNGDAYGYSTSSHYWSGHVGFGHIFDLTDQVESTSRGGTERAARDLDVYGKYFYTHVGGDNFRAGEAEYQLDSLNSSLLRLGARVNNRHGRNNYYYGLAWDYEFDGESNGSVSVAGLGANIRKADIGGSSLMAEAGWKLEATQDNPWDMNLNLRAYAGQHKGIGGNLFVGYHF